MQNRMCRCCLSIKGKFKLSIIFLHDFKSRYPAKSLFLPNLLPLFHCIRLQCLHDFPAQIKGYLTIIIRRLYI